MGRGPSSKSSFGNACYTWKIAFNEKEKKKLLF